MIKYYYDRYEAIGKPYWQQGAWQLHSGSWYSTFDQLYRSYSFDPDKNTYYVTGGTYGTSATVSVGSVGYKMSGSVLEQYQITRLGTYPDATEEHLTSYSSKNPNNSTQTTVYSRGALVQSGIAAEDGSYPIDGRHSDGYWYVRGAVVKTAPTMPGAFTQPTGTLEIGDSKVISWGASTDAENNLSEYVLERSINGGSFTSLVTLTANSYSYTIPTATSIAFRVKARDTDGLESAYRTSPTFTVQPPQYYYDKFNSVEKQNYTYTATEIGTSYTDAATFTARFAIENLITSRFGSSQMYEPPTAYGTISVNSMGNFEMTNPMGINTMSLVDLYNARTSPSAVGTIEFGVIISGAGAGNYLVKVTRNTPSDINYLVSVNALSIKSLPPTYSKGSLVQTGIIGGATTYPMDGRHTDGFWYVRGSRVSQSIAPPTPFTSPTSGKKFKPSEVANIVFGASNAANLSLYEVDYRYNTTGAWTPLAYNNTLTRSLTITTDKTLKTLELRVRAKNTSNVYSDYVYSEPFEIEHNVAPTVSLTGPGDNTTLYENDSYNIGGTAYDDDKDQSVTVYYQINSEQRKVLATNLSQTQISLLKQLTFKAGKLFDGDTALTGTLAEGVAHVLKVWAVDNEGAQSATVERAFYVVPNRAPLLAIDAVVPSGIINADKFAISGTVSDQDANSNVKVNYRINGANPIEIYDGTGGAWEFEVSLGQLKVGENIIVVEVMDNYNAKTSKTIKLNKSNINTPILQSVARYKVEPPKGSAKGVLFWVQRDEGLDLKAELSMTLKGEQESYEQLTAMNTAPVYEGVMEDEFYYETLEPKDNIILKLTTSRADVTIDNKIYLIMGVLE